MSAITHSLREKFRFCVLYTSKAKTHRSYKFITYMTGVTNTIEINKRRQLNHLLILSTITQRCGYGNRMDSVL